MIHIYPHSAGGQFHAVTQITTEAPHCLGPTRSYDLNSGGKSHPQFLQLPWLQHRIWEVAATIHPPSILRRRIGQLWSAGLSASGIKRKLVQPQTAKSAIQGILETCQAEAALQLVRQEWWESDQNDGDILLYNGDDMWWYGIHCANHLLPTQTGRWIVKAHGRNFPSTVKRPIWPTLWSAAGKNLNTFDMLMHCGIPCTQSASPSDPYHQVKVMSTAGWRSSSAIRRGSSGIREDLKVHSAWGTLWRSVDPSCEKKTILICKVEGS